MGEILLQESVRFPDVIRLESSGACNFRCTHCATGQHPGRRGLLLSEVQDALDRQLGQVGFVPRVLVLYHGGEPLLLPHLPQLVRRYKDAGVAKIKITTNASMLSRDKAKALIEAGLDEMYVSFDGESSEENDAIRRNGEFSVSSRNVIEFLRIRRAMGARAPGVRISNIRVLSREEIESYLASGVKGFSSLPEYLQRTFDAWLDEVAFLSLPAMVWPSGSAGEGEIYQLETPPARYCTSAFETITVMANGDVVPCCYDIAGEYVLGNILVESIFDIWNSARANALREGIATGAPIGICRRCCTLSPRYICRASQKPVGCVT